MNITEFRRQFPQYDHVEDEALSRALHDKYYPQVPYEDFVGRFIPKSAAVDYDPKALLRAQSKTIDDLIEQVRAGQYPPPQPQLNVGAGLLRNRFIQAPSQPGAPPTKERAFQQQIAGIWKSALAPEEKERQIRTLRTRYLQDVNRAITEPIQRYFDTQRIQKETTDNDYLSEWVRAWDRGSANVASAALQAYGAVMDSETAKRYATAYQQAAREPEFAKSPKGKNAFDNVLKYVINVTGETVPFTVVTVAGAKFGGLPLAFSTAAMVEGNSAYQDAKMAGVPEGKAKLIGVGVGMMNGAIEFAGGGGTKYVKPIAKRKLTEKIASGAWNWTKRRFRTALTEALEEAAQEVVNLTGESTYRDINWNEALERVGSSALAGGVGGFGISATVGTLEDIATRERTPLLGEPVVTPEEQVPEIMTVEQYKALRKKGFAPAEIGVMDAEDIAEQFKATPNQVKAIHAAAREKGLTEDQYRDLAEETTGKRSAKDMSSQEAARFIEAMKKREAAGETKESRYDELLERAQEGDTAAIEELNAMVQNLDLPTYEQLLQRANSGDAAAALAIQEGRYRKPRTGEGRPAAETGKEVLFREMEKPKIEVIEDPYAKYQERAQRKADKERRDQYVWFDTQGNVHITKDAPPKHRFRRVRRTPTAADKRAELKRQKEASDSMDPKVRRRYRTQAKKAVQNHGVYQLYAESAEDAIFDFVSTINRKIDFGANRGDMLQYAEGKPYLFKYIAKEGEPSAPWDMYGQEIADRFGWDENDPRVTDPYRFIETLDNMLQKGVRTKEGLNREAIREGLKSGEPDFEIAWTIYDMLGKGFSEEDINEAIQEKLKDLDIKSDMTVQSFLEGTYEIESEEIPAEAEEGARPAPERATYPEEEAEVRIKEDDDFSDLFDFTQEEAFPPQGPPTGEKEGGFLNLEAPIEALEKAGTRAARIGGTSAQIGKSAAEKISFRLENIHPALFRAIRDHAEEKQKKTYDSLQKSKRFIKTMKRLKWWRPKAFRVLDYLLKKNDYERALPLLQKFNIPIRDIMPLLEDIFERAKDAGINIEHRANYFPRKVEDMKKFLAIAYNTPGLDRSIITDALKARAERMGRTVDELTDREKADTINTLFRGYKTGGVVMGRPGFAKERKVADYTQRIDKAYFPAAEGLVLYIEQMESEIAKNRFFGRVSRELGKLKGRETYYRNRISMLQKAGNQKKLAQAQAKLDEILKQKEGKILPERGPDIGAITLELVETGEIKPGQEKEVQQTLKAYFNPAYQNAITRIAMEAGYLAALGNSIYHNITQLGEISNPILEDPFTVIPATARVLIRRELVRHRDMPHRLFSEELNLGGGISKFVNRVLTITLGLDHLGKAIHRNTAAMKAFRRAAHKSDPAFIDELKLYFGNEWKDALGDMKRGEVTPNVIKYAFNRVSDRQPITGAEFPTLYYTSPNIARPFFYMFKSFQLNRLNSIIQNVRRDIKRGRPLRGLATFIITMAVYLAADTSMDIIKDMLRGKKIKDLPDYVIDNFLRMIFMTKYQIETLKYKSPSEVAMRSVTPPILSVADDVTRAVKNEDATPLIKYIPFIGREAYEAAKKDIEKDKKRTRSRERTRKKKR